jgi:DNA-binding transcriptional LysR family regulator
MWWEDLGYLDSLCRKATMAAAARELGVDKATVSRRLAALERASPRPLFERRLGRIVPTRYGERALSAFREHERSRERLAAELEQTGDEARGIVRLTVPAFFACEILVPALSGFRSRHPAVDVHVYGSNRVLDLARGEADVALRNVRPNDGSLSAKKVGRLGMATFASREYLARRGGVTACKLDGHELLVYDGGPYSGPGFEWVPEAARRARIVFSANDSLPLREAARAGLGLAVLPQFLGNETPGLVRVDGGGEGVAELWTVTREEIHRVPRVREVIAFVADLVRRNQARFVGTRRSS